MGYTDPETYVVDDFMTAARMNLVSDNLRALVHPVALDLVDKTVTNTTAETSLLNATMTLPANELGANGMMELYVEGIHVGDNSRVLTLRLKDGGATVLTVTGTPNPVSTVYEMGMRWWNRGATNVQYLSGHIFGGNTTFTGQATAAVDTTTARTIDLTAQWSSTASAAVSITASVRLLSAGQLL